MPAWGQGGYGDLGYGDDAYVATDLSPDIVPIDHVALGLSRVITQYTQSTKMLAMLSAILSMSNEVENVLIAMGHLADIDSVGGVNLDVIGRIVGVSRYVADVVTLSWFGFNGYSYETPFGEDGNPQIGSRFYEYGENFEGTSVLLDPEFRLLIKAKILRNASHAHPEDMLAALRFIFSVTQVNVDDNGGMFIQVAIGRQLTATEKAIIIGLDILPRPAAVLMAGVVSYNPNDYFGFDDQPGALSFGEYNVEGTGGIFAEEI